MYEHCGRNECSGLVDLKIVKNVAQPKRRRTVKVVHGLRGKWMENLAYHELLNSLHHKLDLFRCLDPLAKPFFRLQRRFPLAKFSNIRLLKPTFLQIICKFGDIRGVEVAPILPL